MYIKLFVKVWSAIAMLIGLSLILLGIYNFFKFVVKTDKSIINIFFIGFGCLSIFAGRYFWHIKLTVGR